MRFASTLLAATATLSLGALAACGGDDDDARSSADAATDLPVDAGIDASDGLVPVTLRFKGKIGAADLACGQSYPDQGRGKVAAKVQDFRFFLQDVALIDDQGRAVPVLLDERAPYQTRALALVDLTDAKDGCVGGDPGSNTVVTGRVPPGRYQGLRFANGVPETLNHGDPVVAPPPLRAPGVSWSWLQGNRFVIAEMVMAPDLAMDGGAPTTATDAGVPNSSGSGHNATSAPPGLAMVHLGSTGCSGGPGVGFTCTKANRTSVELRDFDPAVDTVVADLGAVFAGVDIAKGLLCHGLGEQCVAPFGALGVDVANGQPLPTQQVFRAE